MYTFLGMVRVDFVSDKTGEQILGWNLWLAEPAETPSVGLCPTKKWLSDESYLWRTGWRGRLSEVRRYFGGRAGWSPGAGHRAEIPPEVRGDVHGSP